MDAALPVGGGFAGGGGVAEGKGEGAGVVFGLEEGDVGDASVGTGLLGYGLDGVVVFLDIGDVEGVDDEAKLGAFGGAVGEPE